MDSQAAQARKIRRHRKAFWDATFTKQGRKRGALQPDQYRDRISAHFDTLQKYVGQFGKQLSVWAIDRDRNYNFACRALGRRRFMEISTGSPVTVNEVRRMYLARDWSREFDHYLVNKTHLSYTVDGTDPCPAAGEGALSRVDDSRYSKLAEFVVLILAEYVILHNYMWCSATRPNGVRSIDRFLNPIKGTGKVHG